MEYDPIKNRVSAFFYRSPFLKVTFYKLLDLLLLRTWHVHKELRKWMKQATDQKNILDAGTGFGQYTYYIASRKPSWPILAVDVNDKQVGEGNKLFRKMGYENVVFKVADLTKFQQPDSFDLVVCVDVMEHILEDVDVFKNYYASLRNGGMVLISTPSDQGGSDVQEDSDESFIGEHVRDGYNINEIQEKLKSAGFQRTLARYSYGPPGQISWRLSMKYPMQMLNTSFLFMLILPFYYLITYPISLILNLVDVNTNSKSGTGLIVKAWKEPVE